MPLCNYNQCGGGKEGETQGEVRETSRKEIEGHGRMVDGGRETDDGEKEGACLHLSLCFRRSEGESEAAAEREAEGGELI